MNTVTVQVAYDEIVAHIKQEGSAYSLWYAGITSDWKDRLFDDHNVSRNGWYAVRRCSTDDRARSVEQALLDIGCDGGPGGGDDSSVFVYAYRITSTTDP